MDKNKIWLMFKRGFLIAAIMLAISLFLGLIGLTVAHVINGGIGYRLLGLIVLVLQFIILGYVSTYVCQNIGKRK